MLWQNKQILPFSQGYDVRKSGVIVGKKGKDNSDALRHAFTTAAAMGVPALLPEGVIEYRPTVARSLFAPCSIIGRGRGASILSCTTVDGRNSRIDVIGDKLTFQGFTMESPNTPYLWESNESHNGLAVRGRTYLSFRDLEFVRTLGASLMLRDVYEIQVEGIYVLDNFKDGVHVTGASQHVQIDGVHAKRCGDDTVAVVGYADGTGAGRPILVSINNVHTSDSIQGRGVAVLGAMHVQLSNLFIENPHAGGLFIGTEVVGGARPYSTYPSEHISADNVHVVNGGKNNVAPIRISGLSNANPSRDINVTNFKVTNSASFGVVVAGGVQDVTLQNGSIDTTTQSAIQMTETWGGTIDNMKLYDIGESGVVIGSGSGGTQRITNIDAKNINTRFGTEGAAADASSNDVVRIITSADFTAITIDEVHLTAQEKTMDRLIENQNYEVTKMGRVTTVRDTGSIAAVITGLPAVILAAGDVTASPYTLPAVDYDRTVRVYGGTVTKLDLKWGGLNPVTLRKKNGFVTVKAHHELIVTYTLKPTISYFATSIT